MTGDTCTQQHCAFIVLYRWRLHEAMEQDFVQAWTEVTRHLLDSRGSLGSRLHKGDDGLWYGYAQWPDADVRRRAFAEATGLPARERMSAAIAESLPEVVLEPVADLLVGVRQTRLQESAQQIVARGF